MQKTALVLAFATLAAGPALAEDLTLGDLTISDLRVYATPETARAGAAYFTVTNSGDDADRLTGVSGDFARVELHGMSMTDDVMMMTPHDDGLTIAPGTALELGQGGDHVMIMGLTAPFVVGDTVDLTLEFESAGSLDVSLPVVPLIPEGVTNLD